MDLPQLNGPAKLDVIYSPEGECPSGHAGAAWTNSSPNAIAFTRGIAGKYYRTEVHHQPWALQR